MGFQYVDVWVEGVMPLLMMNFSDEALEGLPGGSGKKTRQISTTANPTPREMAEKVAYRESRGDPKSALYMPGPAFQKLMIEAGGNHKAKASRKSLKYTVPAAVLVMTEQVPLYDTNRKDRLFNFEVDSRTVVNRVTKGRMLCHRPRLEEWAAKFTVRINEELMDPKIVRQLLTEGGQQIGIGAFRPEKCGTFGMFDVVAWDCVDGRSAISSKKRRPSVSQEVML